MLHADCATLVLAKLRYESTSLSIQLLLSTCLVLSAAYRPPSLQEVIFDMIGILKRVNGHVTSSLFNKHAANIHINLHSAWLARGIRPTSSAVDREATDAQNIPHQHMTEAEFQKHLAYLNHPAVKERMRRVHYTMAGTAFARNKTLQAAI